MKRNVGTVDRGMRLCAGIALFACSVFGPFDVLVRVLAFAIPGCYLTLTALFGTCACYALLGRSTASTISKA